jgi:outer membrane lipoprotein-sorting protein
LRWLSPVLVVGLLIGVAHVRAGGPRRSTVPARNAAQVVALVGPALRTSRSGTFTLSTNLGLGDVAASASGNQLVSLAGGSNLARVWTDGGTRSRVALLQPLQETDWVRTSAGTWVWQSSATQAAYVQGSSQLNLPALGAITSLVGETSVEPPDALASRLLTLSEQSAVSLGPSDYVAGRRTYELVLTPRSHVSLISHVTIAVDATTGLPLRVAEYVRGQGSPIVDDQFQSVSYSEPAASNFEFRPPPNARVLQAPTLRAALEGPRHHRERRPQPGENGGGDRPGLGAPTAIRIVGSGWNEVLVASGVPDFGLGDLFGASTSVSGAFGHGLLARTSALSVLFLDDGRLAAGVVTPARLEAALA